MRNLVPFSPYASTAHFTLFIKAYHLLPFHYLQPTQRSTQLHLLRHHSHLLDHSDFCQGLSQTPAKTLFVSFLGSSFPFLSGFSWIFLIFQRICLFGSSYGYNHLPLASLSAEPSAAACKGLHQSPPRTSRGVQRYWLVGQILFHTNMQTLNLNSEKPSIKTHQIMSG